MGYAIGVDHITNMVEKINQQDADIVIIAGDIFDNSYDGMDDPEGIKAQLKSIKSKYGVYAVYGNHDIDEKILMGFTFDWGGKQLHNEKMTNFMKECNIKLINDESVLINDEFFAGRAYIQKRKELFGNAGILAGDDVGVCKGFRGAG